ncbi:uncharacterized protein [Temnothorax nylanderi]|uniref:uncharacterized protein n=1 Tax=Temnothorax nylanderi TaxID=102681 RepID=UPI003A857122
MASNRYTVIEFDDGVTLAAEKWLTPRKTQCYWPPYNSKSRTLKAVETQEDVSENWSLYKIKKIFASTKTFKRGKEKCSEALTMSDINTDSEREKVKSTKKSSIGPFPIIDFNNAAGSSHNEDGKAEKSDLNTVSNKYGIRTNHCKTIPTTKSKDFPGSEQSVDTDDVNAILRAIADLNIKIDGLINDVRDIKKYITAKTTNEEIERTESQILKVYPLLTEVDLIKEEKRLSSDVHYKNNLIKDLGIFVLNDVKSTVSKLMSEIMSNALASNYSFHGAHKKKAFQKLKLYEVISSVVRCRFTKPLVVNKDISDPIKSWLRHAPARLSREQKKAIMVHDSERVVNNDEVVDDEVVDEMTGIQPVNNTVANNTSKSSNGEVDENVTNNDF